MAYTRGIVNVPGRYAGVARQTGDEISLAEIPVKTVKAMILAGRISPIGESALPPSVDSTEAGYLDGTESNVQDQLDAKAVAADVTLLLRDYAKTTDIANMVETADIANMVETADLAGYVQTAAIANMVETADLAGYIAIADLKTLTAAAADFAAFQVAIAALGV